MGHSLTKCLVAVAGVMAACIVRAEEDSVPRIEINNVPLTAAIQNFARQMDINYILDPRVPGSYFGPGRKTREPDVTGSWTNVSAQGALSALLKEHKLMLISNRVTTVARIAPVDWGVKPVSESQVRTNTGKVIPVVFVNSEPLTKAVTDLAEAAGIKVTFDRQVSGFDNEGVVGFRWENITAGQALAALLDNCGLVMTEDSATSSALISCPSISPWFQYTGGDGSSIAAAVLIKGASGREAVTAAQKAWLLKRYPKYKGELLPTFARGDRIYDMWGGSSAVIFDVTNLHVDKD